MRLNHLPAMLALARTVLAPKQLCAPDANTVEYLCVQLVQAFVLSAGPGGDPAEDGASAGIRIQEVLGPPPRASTCLDGVLIDTPVPLDAVGKQLGKAVQVEFGWPSS